ncbi:MAG TPA: hypothetical protein VGI14_03460 [Casimicrobiaceae bacterium]|jgi:outer membrane lipoprotein SlyB
MKRVVATTIVALAMTGCATATAPGPQASAASDQQECKAVTVYTASQEIRNANRTGVPGSQIEKAAGAAEIGRVAGFPPAGVRDDTVAKSGNLAGQVMTRC